MPLKKHQLKKTHTKKQPQRKLKGTEMFKNNKFGVSDAMIEAAKAIIEKKLIGNQHKIDANHNGKIDAQDFKILKGKKKTNEEVELGEDTFTKQYRNNEDDNKHSENVVLLAKHFGSKTDHEKAKDILQQHMKIGHMPDNLRDEREKIQKKLWPKARAHMMHQEEVEFSEAEIARIETIAKSI
jgi:hypothetical protein